MPRLSGHSGHDNQGYKTESELAAEWARDPLEALRTYLVPRLYSESEWADLVARVVGDVAAARDMAKAQRDAEVADVLSHIWHDPDNVARVGGLANEKLVLPAGTAIPSPPHPARINMIEAIRRTLEVELAVNDRCLVFGEDVGAKGGVHAATLGLQKTYGDRRVFDTSLSEEGIIGRSVAMAMAGLMPVPKFNSENMLIRRPSSSTTVAPFAGAPITILPPR